MTRLRVLVVGVGGQGVLTAARAIGDAATRAGLEVAVGQMHGMSQRGGSVEASAIVGSSRRAFIGDGEADVLLAFEALELVRALPRVSPTTTVIAARVSITPFTLTLAGERPPTIDACLDRVRPAVAELVALDAPALVREAGDARTLNVLMLGALDGAGRLPFDGAGLLAEIERRASPRALEPNRRAFALGREAAARGRRSQPIDRGTSCRHSARD